MHAWRLWHKLGELSRGAPLFTLTAKAHTPAQVRCGRDKAWKEREPRLEVAWGRAAKRTSRATSDFARKRACLHRRRL